MDIYYTDSTKLVDWNEVAALFKSVDWGDRDPAVIKSSFKKSSFVRLAFVDDKLVGVGRTVDDGAFYGWIVDLAVLPDYQGKGIGSYILRELENELKPFVTTMLTAAPGKNGFYERHGWLKQSGAYIFPRSDAQIRDFSDRQGKISAIAH